MDEIEQVLRERMGDEAYKKHQAEIRKQEEQFARLAVARELDRSGRLEEAIRIYEQLATDGCGHAHIYLRLAVIYRKSKRYDDEIRVMEKGLQVWREFDYGDAVNKGGPMMAQYTERLEKAKALRAKARGQVG
jgi:tetratricopeptide (TPR) repeat protein